MRRGAVLRLVFLVFTGWGEWCPVFSCLHFFVPRLFVPLPSCFALIPPLERMISHVFPWALT